MHEFDVGEVLDIFNKNKLQMESLLQLSLGGNRCFSMTIKSFLTGYCKTRLLAESDRMAITVSVQITLRGSFEEFYYFFTCSRSFL